MDIDSWVCYNVVPNKNEFSVKYLFIDLIFDTAQ